MSTLDHRTRRLPTNMPRRSSPASTTGQLALPTPCAEWDVRATLDHLIGATWMFTLVNQDQAVGEDAGGIGGDDPVVALTNAAEANIASWRAPGAFDGDRTFPFGTFPADAAAMMNLSEVVVHTWDIATALGADATIDPTVAEMVDDVLPADVARPVPRARRVRCRDPRRLERPACRSAARAARPPAGVTVMQIQAARSRRCQSARRATLPKASTGARWGSRSRGAIADPVPMVFFTLGHHHDFAVMELGQHGPSPDRHTAGLAHVAFKVGDSLDEFDAVKRELEAAGVVILFELDHGFTKGMHMHDPDGNEVELFVDVVPAP